MNLVGEICEFKLLKIEENEIYKTKNINDFFKSSNNDFIEDRYLIDVNKKLFLCDKEKSLFLKNRELTEIDSSDPSDFKDYIFVNDSSNDLVKAVKELEFFAIYLSKNNFEYTGFNFNGFFDKKISINNLSLEYLTDGVVNDCLSMNVFIGDDELMLNKKRFGFIKSLKIKENISNQLIFVRNQEHFFSIEKIINK